MFSIIMPTRDRPALFSQALASVLAQSFRDFEVIVVNDGSAATHQCAYDAILRDTAGAGEIRVRGLNLIQRPAGHGESYAINIGADAAIEPYLCFLDDDDCWTDAGHLARVQKVIEGARMAPDLVMTNQAAFLNGERKPGPIWIEDLPAILSKSGKAPDELGAYTVTVEELMRSWGFCHLNTLIVRRALFREIGGMDKTIRWECDRDLYLRLIDRAEVMRYLPVVVARHNIPDPAKRSNVTTALSELERRLSQLPLLDRSALFARHPRIRAHCRLNKAYALKRIVESLSASGRREEALWYALEALGAGPGIKWAGYTAWLWLRARASR
ncbi:MAG: glycosyltransferase family 2 protein [Acetobacteraceae bacterium]